MARVFLEEGALPVTRSGVQGLDRRSGQELWMRSEKNHAAILVDPKGVRVAVLLGTEPNGLRN